MVGLIITIDFDTGYLDDTSQLDFAYFWSLWEFRKEVIIEKYLTESSEEEELKDVIVSVLLSKKQLPM